MTIAAGFVARGGILLCTDSLYSGGVNVHGRKIFTHKYPAGVVSFAIAGHELLAKKTVQDCDDIVRTNPDYCVSVPTIRRMIEQTIKSAHEQYVETRPHEERDAYRFQLLIAIATREEGAFLFSSSGPVLAQVENYECLGTGGYVGHHIIQNAYRPGMSLDQVATIAIHALGAAKRYVEGVGGPSQFECIRDSAVMETLGRHFPYDLATIMDMEITTYEDETARLLSAIATSELNDDEFEQRVLNFVKFARQMRTDWKSHSERSDLYRALRS
jgi:20S proteasome alpha/beta subunit